MVLRQRSAVKALGGARPAPLPLLETAHALAAQALFRPREPGEQFRALAQRDPDGQHIDHGELRQPRCHRRVDVRVFIDQQLQVTDYLTGLAHQNTTAPAWCPGFGSDCTQPVLESPIDDLTLDDVTGGLIDDYFLLTVTAHVPGTGAKITFMCGMSSQRVVVEPVLHGAPPVAVQNSLVRFPDLSATLQFVYPTSIESVTVKLTPINPTGCP